MDRSKIQQSNGEGYLFFEARVLALSLVAIRSAQSKPNPHEFQVGTARWAAIVADFAADLTRMQANAVVRLASSSPDETRR